jgi:cobalt-zinc-cadmium resistance protein CzcA
VPPAKDHGPRWLSFLAHWYEAVLPTVLRWRWPLLAGSVALLLVVGWRFGAAGAEFVPRIFEGDAMVTIKRAPSISLEEAKRLDLASEKVLVTFPEIVSAVALTGRAEVAIDPVGNDNTDIMIRLRPQEEWTTARDFDDLSEQIKIRIESQVPGTFVSVSQPIEDKTNEMISGSRADVAIQIFGEDTFELAELADKVGDTVRTVQGAGDVRVERILGQPTLNARANRARMARYGVKAEDAFSVLEAARAGVQVGTIYEEQRRFALRVIQPPRQPTKEAIGELPVTNHAGEPVPLAEVVSLTEEDGPTAIRRQNRERAVRIDINLRGRDLISFVAEARQLVADKFPLKNGYRIEWGGQFENFERAQKRLAIVVPVVIAIIFGMLLWMFGNARLALAVFALVPLSLTGGMAGLLARGMSFSLPAAVGFIALGGIGVLNGVVMATEVRKRLHDGLSVSEAVLTGSGQSLRAVLTTATVAALGFLPMAIATSAGAEVQRPLATAVIVGMLGGTALTVLVLPGLLYLALQRRSDEQATAQVPPAAAD